MFGVDAAGLLVAIRQEYPFRVLSGGQKFLAQLEM